MHGKIVSYLDFSLPRLLTSRRGWLLSLAVSVYIIAMVNFEHPFGGHVEGIPYHHWFLSGLGGVCIVIYLLFFQVFPVVFKNNFNWENATIVEKFFHLMLFTVLMFGANILYVMLVIPPPEITPNYLLHIAYFTVAFNFVPILAFNAYRKISFMIIKKEIKDEIPESSPQQPILSIPVDLTVMKGGIYQPEEIKYFKVYGNYQKMYFDSETPATYEMLTGSMVHLEELLVLHPEFMRCNQKYLINTKKIRTCIGSRSFIMIKLKNCDVEFKVYRNKTAGFMPFCTKNKK